MTAVAIRVALVTVGGLGALAGSVAPDQAPGGFRAAAELILVDAQVVDRKGEPVGDLTSRNFRVQIDGQSRPVVSVQFIRAQDRAVETPTSTPATRPSQVTESTELPAARNFVLAIDESSFSARHALAVKQAARRFVERTGRRDRIGVFRFPMYDPILELTTDHDSVLRDVDRLTGVMEYTQSR